MATKKFVAFKVGDFEFMTNNYVTMLTKKDDPSDFYVIQVFCEHVRLTMHFRNQLSSLKGR